MKAKLIPMPAINAVSSLEKCLFEVDRAAICLTNARIALSQIDSDSPKPEDKALWNLIGEYREKIANDLFVRVLNRCEEVDAAAKAGA